MEEPKQEDSEQFTTVDLQKEIEVVVNISNNSSSTDHYISDNIKVDIIPEKRGTFLKYTEYQIKSENNNALVEHRYNDFLSFFDYLLRAYEFRMVPRLPPKLLLNSFLEDRRRSLERWLTLLSQHPVISRDEVLKVFLTKSSMDFQDLADETDDEYYQIAPTIQLGKYNNVEEIMLRREQMRKILNQLIELRRLITQLIKNKLNQRNDYGSIANALRAFMISTKDRSMSDFAQNFVEVSKTDENGAESNVVERLDMIIEVVIAFNDLCDRIIQLKQMSPCDKPHTGFNGMRFRNMIRNNLTNATLEEELERSEQQKKRVSFGIYCINEEFLVMQKYLKNLPSIILQFTYEESKTYREISQILQAVVGIESDKLN